MSDPIGSIGNRNLGAVQGYTPPKTSQAGGAGGAATGATQAPAEQGDGFNKTADLKELEQSGEAGASSNIKNVISALQAPVPDKVDPANSVAQTKGLEPGMNNGSILAAGPNGFQGGGDPGFGGGVVHSSKPVAVG